MTNPHSDTKNTPAGHARGPVGIGAPFADPGKRLRAYLIGFALAVVLTAIPFAMVQGRWLTGDSALLAIGILAAVQIVVHMHFFLGLDFRSRERANMLALALTLILLTLMVLGSLWIMSDLHHRMMM